MRKSVFTLCALLMSVVLLATGASAASAPAMTATQIYEDAMKKMADIQSIEYNGSFSFYADGLSETVDLSMLNGAMNMKQVIRPDKTVEMAYVTKAGDETVSLYVRDGYTYTQAGNEKIKYKMDDSLAMQQNSMYISDIEKSWLSGATVTEETEGRRIMFTLSGNQMNDLMGLVYSEADLQQLLKDMQFDGVVYNTLIGYDGTVKDLKLTYHISANMGDTPLQMQVVYYMKVASINSIEKIDFPADLNSYKLVDNDQLTPATQAVAI